MPDLAAGPGITLAKEAATDLLRISTDVVSGRRIEATYADLALITTDPDGMPAEVPTTDAGTHTDPVVGGTVNNTGIFRWSASPAGWERLSDVDALSGSGYATAAAASAAAAAASELAALAAASLGLATGAPTLSGAYDSFTAHNANAFSYSKAAAGTGVAVFPIANLAAGSSVVIAYRYPSKTGATPLAAFGHTDASNGTTTSVATPDNTWRFITLTVATGKTASSVRVSTSGAASGTAEIIIMPGATAAAALAEMMKRSGIQGFAQSMILDTLGMLGGALVSDQQLRTWTEGESYEVTAATWGTDGTLTTATVKWPGGSAGTFTPTTSSLWGVDAYTITHTVSGKTVTQAAVTRDSNGNITAKPALTVA